MFVKLWNDDAGIVALEYLFLATVVGIALVVGFSSLATAINVEYTELANAILALNQSYSYEAASGCSGTHGGVNVTDAICTLTYGQSPDVTPTVLSGSISLGCCP